MKIRVLDSELRQNVASFKDFIRRLVQSEQEKGLKKVTQAFINKKTGEIHLAELEKKPLSERDWKQIQISICPEKGPFFEVSSEKAFELKDLNPKAYVRLSETIHLLNQIAYDPETKERLEAITEQFCSLDLEGSTEREQEHDFIQKAWHFVDRLGVEDLLEGKKMGTYFFRKDSYAAALEKKLNESSSELITCLTLCYVDEEGKACEQTLVEMDGHWLFYDDDVHLSGPKYRTLKEALASHTPELESPLFPA